MLQMIPSQVMWQNKLEWSHEIPTCAFRVSGRLRAAQDLARMTEFGTNGPNGPNGPNGTSGPNCPFPTSTC